jgi:hypothetical protein
MLRMTAIEAFQNLLDDTEYLEQLEISERRKIASYKSMLKKKRLNPNNMNIDTLLERHGFVKVTEPQWEKK